MVPAYVANMAPPFVRYWKGWNRPISPRWLGSHKTVVGFVAGVFAAVLVAFLQSRLGWGGTIADYGGWLGPRVRLGAGAVLGGTLRGLFQRRRGRAPGGTLIPLQQLHFVLGAPL